MSERLKLLVLETSEGTKALSSVGSNPTSLTKPPQTVYKSVDKQCAFSAVHIFGTYGGSSSIGGASDCGSEGCGFDSRLSPQGGFAK